VLHTVLLVEVEVEAGQQVQLLQPQQGEQEEITIQAQEVEEGV
jgi:hypothetical protein